MEWRSIETAPKDGTNILIFARDFPAIAWWANVYYFNYDKDEMVEGEEWAQWICDNPYYNSVLTGDRTPTHWMPLPNPPEGATS